MKSILKYKNNFKIIINLIYNSNVWLRSNYQRSNGII